VKPITKLQNIHNLKQAVDEDSYLFISKSNLFIF